jgi:hypothetical protein
MRASLDICTIVRSWSSRSKTFPNFRDLLAYNESVVTFKLGVCFHATVVVHSKKFSGIKQLPPQLRADLPHLTSSFSLTHASKGLAAPKNTGNPIVQVD